jgi:hypothetical protein
MMQEIAASVIDERRIMVMLPIPLFCPDRTNHSPPVNGSPAVVQLSIIILVSREGTMGGRIKVAKWWFMGDNLMTDWVVSSPKRVPTRLLFGEGGSFHNLRQG